MDRLDVSWSMPNLALTRADHMPNASAPSFKTLSELVSMSTLMSTSHVEDQTCTICQENYMKGPNPELALKLPGCGHVFGVSCISAWINGKKNTCPMCRKPILDIQMPPCESFFDDDSEDEYSDSSEGEYRASDAMNIVEDLVDFEDEMGEA